MAFGDVLIALLVGFIFGFVLDRGGLNRYFKIANVFRYTDLTVLRFMMTGMAVGLVGIYTLKFLDLADLTPVAPTVVGAQVIGGLIFGVGMAWAGFCPGTCIAGAARGQLDYLIPGMLGLLTGGLAYGLLYPTSLIKGLLSLGRLDQPYSYLPELLGVDPMLLMLVFVQAVIIFVYVLARLNVRRRDALRARVESERAAAGLEQQPVQRAQSQGAGD